MPPAEADDKFHEVETESGTYSYSITDMFQRNRRTIAAYEAGTHPAAALGSPPPPPLDPEQDVYPKTDTYQFQEFAGVVFELGGYGDITMVDPYTLRRLWVGDALNTNDRGSSDYLLNAIRRACDVADAVGFFGKEQ